MEWIDCLRGLVMLMVVFGHCEIYLPDWNVSDVGLFTGRYHVLIFFFISGFLFCTDKFTFSAPGILTADLRKKLRTILWPTLVMLSLFYFMFFRHQPLEVLANDNYKSGYWFTIVLMELYVLSMPLICLLNWRRLPQVASVTAVVAVMLIAGLSPEILPGEFWDSKTVHFFSLELVLRMWPFFLLGVLGRVLYNGHREKLAGREALICSIVILIAGSLWHYGNPEGLLALVQQSVVVAGIFMVCLGAGELLSSRYAVSRFLARVGRATLVVYLFHYFVLLTSHRIVSHFLTRPWISDRITIVPVTLLVTLFVIVCCMLADKLLRRTKLHALIFPPSGQRLMRKLSGETST
ncbi:MAG: acyltransferase [Candidatus Amulumruptor caecigallinarius]|nr:acyltransferase [Candidatus Amulumruptor caecigallinarius]MCM1396657.1 acyltransferase [Candidatus Amulumruptor caecigallinarius]MCM1453285.1 acyltransferase [bacterium]